MCERAGICESLCKRTQRARSAAVNGNQEQQHPLAPTADWAPHLPVHLPLLHLPAASPRCLLGSRYTHAPAVTLHPSCFKQGAHSPSHLHPPTHPSPQRLHARHPPPPPPTHKHNTPIHPLTLHPQLLRGLVRRKGNPQDGPHHLAKLDDLVHTAAHGVHRNGKPHTAVGAAGGIDGGVDADEAA